MGAPAQPPTSQPFNPYSPPFPNAPDFQPQQPMYGEFPNPPYAPNNTFPNQSSVPMQQPQYNMLAQPIVQDMAFQYGQQVFRIFGFIEKFLI